MHLYIFTICHTSGRGGTRGNVGLPGDVGDDGPAGFKGTKGRAGFRGSRGEIYTKMYINVKIKEP